MVTPTTNNDLPPPIVLMFTDIVGSVDLKKRVSPEAYGRLIRRHDVLFHETVNRIPGAEVLKDTGDGFFARFPTSKDAVNAALLFQFCLNRDAPEGPAMKVRIGLHGGEVTILDHNETDKEKVVGLAADVTARLMSLAGGDQILMSKAVFELARDEVTVHPSLGEKQSVPSLSWSAHGHYLLQGLDDPIEVYEVGADGLAPMRAPSDSEKVRRSLMAGEEETLGWRPAPGVSIPLRSGWLVKERLGDGGFGEVWLAENSSTGQLRVFKFCFDSQKLRSLKRELTLFRMIRDTLGDRADIAQLHEVQLDQFPFYLESEYTSGGDFKAWTARRGGLDTVPMEDRLEIMAKVCDAVAASHSVGVLHKDIKPANVLIEERGGRVQPRLADFGIGALQAEKGSTESSITLAGFTQTLVNEGHAGTPMYTPPEVLSGERFTTKGDVYALGVMLYQVAVGDLSRPLAVGWERGITDPVLLEDISNCVDGSPDHRLGDASVLASRIRNLAFRNASRNEEHRNQKKLERQRRTMVMGGITALVVFALLGGFAILKQRESDQRAVSEARQRALAEKASREAQRAKTITRFLGEMLSSASIVKGGKDVKVIDVMDTAAEQLNEAFVQDPEVEIALRLLLGSLFHEMAEAKNAEEQLREAIRIQEERGGGESDLYTEAMEKLGGLLADRSRVQEAEVLLERVLASESAKGASTSGVALAAMVGLSDVAASRGDFETAAKYALPSLTRKAELFAERPPGTYGVVRIRARVFDDELIRRKAIELYPGLIERMKASDPGNIIKPAVTAFLLGLAFQIEGQFEEAEKYHRQALEEMQVIPGDVCMNPAKGLGEALISQGKIEEAEKVFRDQLEPRGRVAYIFLVEFLRGQGRYKEEEALQRNILENMGRLNSHDRVYHLYSLALNLRTQGRLAEAEQYAAEAMQLGIEHIAVDDRTTNRARGELIEILTLLGKLEEAERLSLQQVEIADRTLGSEHRKTITAHEQLATIQQKKAEQAAEENR